ncbi:conjugal transfer protein TrbF (plasmid) [Klebsiella pneumoniae]|uniref:Conjugal transfer protein TrbF n=1 Tax=Klebsiella pneumoniae TaxID=573 RepID=A0A2U7XX07_KLEPN|nr:MULTISPECIES: conjugal transfer protein TrbF [Enterobacteriaceae]AVX52259.1 hypothetical protein pKP91-00098 [Klebsiella pneumoniae]MBC3838279.1 conjugal transfer protein TrbF [Klebsiella pneumoniae]MBN3340014.1 hypothetical protein [Klebsiella pneumoniae]MBW5667537.1 conjugal transfer protein TrbF [Klebsiella pneumoniae]MCJ7359432.1 conjugal transfer protein TrbF [Klebsiella pneumoniae]
MDIKNRVSRRGGLFLIPDSLTDTEILPGDKIKTLRSEYIYQIRHVGLYLDLCLVFLVSGALLFGVMRSTFDLCVDGWIASGELRVKDLWNILMYVIPLTLLAVSAGLFITGVISSVMEFISFRLKAGLYLRKEHARKNSLNNGGQNEN